MLAMPRVPELASAARFYRWLLGVEPKAWTHRYVTFVSEALRTNFVLVVSDGESLRALDFEDFEARMH